MDTVELYPVDMAEITVRAEQRTVDWDEGAVFVVERTEYLDKLIADGRLTVVDSGGSVVEPPRSGKGSGAEVWRNFLEHQGVEFSETDNREELIERWNSHKLLSEVDKAKKAVAQTHADIDSTPDARGEAAAQLQEAREQATETIADLNKELDES